MDLQTVLMSLAVGLLLLGLGILLVFALREFQLRHPSTLLKHLEPLVWHGIAAALLIAKKASAELRTEIDGWDMASIANATYDLIPNVSIFGRVITADFIRSVITRKQWVDFIKTRYDAFRAWELMHEEHLTNQVAALKDPPMVAPGTILPVPPVKEVDVTQEG